jgi:hypothetical protein
VVNSTPQPHSTPGKDPVPIVQEAGWAPGPVWTGGKSRPTGIRSPDRPARSQSLYRLNYLAHTLAISIHKVDLSNLRFKKRIFPFSYLASGGESNIVHGSVGFLELISYVSTSHITTQN